METLGSKLRKLVNGSPYTIRDFAERVGTTTGTLSKIYNGRYVLSTELGMKLDTLLGEGVGKELLHYQVDWKIWELGLDE